MKFKNPKHDLYFQVVCEYLDGEGIDFEKHNINRSEIQSFCAFVHTYFRPEIATAIDGYIISMLTEN